jgi:hypothetical protein
MIKPIIWDAIAQKISLFLGTAVTNSSVVLKFVHEYVHTDVGHKSEKHSKRDTEVHYLYLKIICYSHQQHKACVSLS